MLKKHRQFSGEFKQKVVEDMLKNKLGYRETMRKYEITSHESVQRWERIYLEEGAEGLHIERRGRATGPQKGRPPQFKKKADEDLIKEVLRLRAENAYLKKLNALVHERELREKKHKRSGS